MGQKGNLQEQMERCGKEEEVRERQKKRAKWKMEKREMDVIMEGEDTENN